MEKVNNLNVINPPQFIQKKRNNNNNNDNNDLPYLDKNDNTQFNNNIINNNYNNNINKKYNDNNYTNTSQTENNFNPNNNNNSNLNNESNNINNTNFNFSDNNTNNNNLNINTILITNKIINSKDSKDSKDSINSSKKSINISNSSSNSEKINSILNTKKIIIDLNKKKYQDDIKSILQSVITSENKFNDILKSNINININKNNYSPCFIVSKTFIEDIKLSFNYDYFKQSNKFDIDILLKQRNNEPFYINDIQDITLNDFKDNNIALLDENAFLMLNAIRPYIRDDKGKYKEYEIFLKDNKGIIIIEEDINNSKFLFIFSVDNNDINKIKNYELIDFTHEENTFKKIKEKLGQDNNILDDIWLKIINNFSNNLYFIINDKNNIDTNIGNIINKIKKLKEYLQRNISLNKDEIFYNKLEEFKTALNIYEELLNKKEELINHKMMNYNNFHKFTNFNYNQIINNKVQLYRFKPSLGLDNIGSTCYMNATIQCLAHIPELSEELIQIFLNNNNNNNNNYYLHKNLTKEYTLFLINIFELNNNNINDNGSYAPYNLKNIIGNQDSLFIGNEAQDAKDLLIFLIETMNTELNGGISPIYNDIVRLGIDTKDLLKIKQTFLNDFNSKNFSPFSKWLYGFSLTTSLCQKCQNQRYSYECFNLLIFPLLEIKNYILKYNYNNQYILNIYDCFKFYNKEEFFVGNNKMFCQDCNSEQDVCVKRMIDNTPPVLIIILDRGLDNMDFQENFDYDEYLDLNNLLANENNYTQYYLCGIICHLGASGPSGHFVAFCKMDMQSPWYLYNDSSVTEYKDQKDIFNRGTPYILFYHYFNN